jgi:hypothetical protein
MRTQAPKIYLTWPLSAFTRDAEYPPCNCPDCKQKLWSHGFRDRNLENTKIVLKRLRCPKCCKVTSIRPAGMLDYFQTLLKAMIVTLEHRLTFKSWPLDIPRQRAGHWLRAFYRHHRMHAPDQSPKSYLGLLANESVNFFDKGSWTKKR